MSSFVKSGSVKAMPNLRNASCSIDKPPFRFLDGKKVSSVGGAYAGSVAVSVAVVPLAPFLSPFDAPFSYLSKRAQHIYCVCAAVLSSNIRNDKNVNKIRCFAVVQLFQMKISQRMEILEKFSYKTSTFSNKITACPKITSDQPPYITVPVDLTVVVVVVDPLVVSLVGSSS